MREPRSRNAIRLISALVVLTGCAHGPSAPIEDRAAGVETEVTPVPPPPRPGPAIDIATSETSSSPPPAAEPAPAVAAPSSPVMRQLLAVADADLEAGRYGSAAAGLDRAMRLAPSDPQVWHDLARLRFAQGDYAQAKASAQRSIALPGAPSRLLAANWFLIAEIERIKGNQAASDAASGKARLHLGDASGKAPGN